jgi:hypothetical protein
VTTAVKEIVVMGICTALRVFYIPGLVDIYSKCNAIPLFLAYSWPAWVARLAGASVSPRTISRALAARRIAVIWEFQMA